MKIVCVGGGPAGLYFSILMKRYDNDHDITVFERNRQGSTDGWGVTYYGNLLTRSTPAILPPRMPSARIPSAGPTWRCTFGARRRCTRAPRASASVGNA